MKHNKLENFQTNVEQKKCDPKKDRFYDFIT